MRKLVKGMLTCAVVALAALVAAPALAAGGADDTAGFYVAEKLLVGNVELQPGIYLVRAVHAVSSRNVLVVTDVEGTEVFATLLVTPHHLAAQDVRDVSRLLYEPGDGARPNALRSFLVANSPFGYDIYSRSAGAPVATAGLREITAVAALR